MRTPEEFEPLGLWMGWRKIKRRIRPFCIEEFWCSTSGGEDIKAVAFKTSFTDAEAIEALERLVEKGYFPRLEFMDDSMFWSLIVSLSGYARVASATKPTIHEAVEEAILRLIAAEGA